MNAWTDPTGKILVDAQGRPWVCDPPHKPPCCCEQGCLHPCFMNNVGPCVWNYTSHGESGQLFYSGICQWADPPFQPCVNPQWVLNIYWCYGLSSVTCNFLPGDPNQLCNWIHRIVLTNVDEGIQWSANQPLDIHCRTPIVLSNLVYGGSCTGVPATVTLTPLSSAGDDPTIFFPCSPGLRCDWKLVTSGIAGGPSTQGCVDCTYLNGTFTLKGFGSLEDGGLNVPFVFTYADWYTLNFAGTLIGTLKISCNAGTGNTTITLINTGQVTDTLTIPGLANIQQYTFPSGSTITPVP